MMKKIKKIGGLVTIFLLNLYNTCFADLVIPEGEIRNYIPVEPEFKSVNYILIGILVLVIAVCAVIIIKRIIKNKKEKANDGK